MAIIGKIRKRGGLAVGIVAVAILAFIFSDLLTKNRGDSMPSKVASIDNMDVNINEFNSRSEQLEQQIRAQQPEGKMTQEQTFQAKLMAFQQLISEKLFNRECQKIGISVGEEETNNLFLGEEKFLSNMARQQFTDPKTGQYNSQGVKQFLQQYDKLQPEQQQAWQTMKKQAIDERMQQKYAIVLAKSFYMPKAMAKQLAQMYDSQADTRYAVLSLGSISDDKIKLTDKDYQDYYEQHKNMFVQTEDSRDLEFVKFEVVPSPNDIKAINDSVQNLYNELINTPNEDIESFVSASADNKYDSIFHKRSDREITTYFADSILSGVGAGNCIQPFQVGNNWVMGKVLAEQARPDSVKFSIIAVFNNKASDQIKRSPEQEKQLVDSLYQVISKDPTLFEENVAKFSDDPNTKNNFGDQGWLLDGQLPEDMFKQITACPEGGVFIYNRADSVADYIIKVTGKTALQSKIQLAQVVIGIRPSDKTINDMRDKANIFLSQAKDLTAMNAQAKKQNLNINSSTVGQMSYQLDGTPYARDVVAWAFGNKVKKNDVATEIFELQNIDNFQDMFIVVALKDINEKGFIPLEKLKENPDFVRMVKAEKKLDQLLTKANDILKNAKTIEDFALKANCPIDTVLAVDFSTPYYGKAGAEVKVIGTIAATKHIGLTKPIKGFSGVYVVNIDKLSKRPIKEDVEMIRNQYNMQIQRRMQQISPIGYLYERAEVENYFTKIVSK